MPNLFQNLANRFVPPKNPQFGPLPEAQAIAPPWVRKGFEGGISTALGFLGVGPDDTANRFGNLIGAASPFLMSRTVGPMARMGELIDPIRKTTSAAQTAGKVIPKLEPILDDAGRFLGFHPPANPAFEAHVASSRNKLPMPKGVNQTGKYSSLAPSQDQMERIMNKYKR